MSDAAKTRVAALAALAAAVLAAGVLVATVFTSPLAVAGACAALVVAAGCAWLALTRSGAVRAVAVVLVATAVAAAIAALYLGSAGWGVVLFVAAVAVFGIASRSVGRRTLARPRTRHVPTQSSAPGRSGAAAPRAGEAGVLIMNPKSGGGKAERFHLADEARRRGIATIELRPGDDLRALAEQAARTAAALGMAGGDGSQALVAEVAMRHSLPYVCVPAGTRNHLALDLGLDRDEVVAALDGFTEGVERQIDIGLVNGRVFVNNVSLGAYADIVQSDAYRDAKLRTMEQMLPELIGPDAQPLDLRFTDGDGLHHDTAQLVMVSNNPYRLDRLLGAGSRPALDSGLLGVMAIEIASPAQAAALFALETVGRARQFGGWMEWTAPSFVVESGTRVPAGVDGEALVLEPPLRFEIVPRALTVLLPPSAVGLSPAALAPGAPGTAVRELWAAARTGGREESHP